MIVEEDEKDNTNYVSPSKTEHEDIDFDDFEYDGEEGSPRDAAAATTTTSTTMKTTRSSPSSSSNSSSVTTTSTPPPTVQQNPPISRTATPGSAARRWSERFVQKNPRSLGICSVHISTLRGRHEEEGPWYSCVINPNQTLTRHGGTAADTYNGVLEFMDALEQEHSEEGGTSSFIDRSSEVARDPFGYFMSGVNVSNNNNSPGSSPNGGPDEDEEEQEDSAPQVQQGSVWL